MRSKERRIVAYFWVFSCQLNYHVPRLGDVDNNS